jgi:hypothetical protein
VLNVVYPGGRTRQLNLRPERVPQAQEWIDNYRRFKATLEQIRGAALQSHFPHPPPEPSLPLLISDCLSGTSYARVRHSCSKANFAPDSGLYGKTVSWDIRLARAQYIDVTGPGPQWRNESKPVRVNTNLEQRFMAGGHAIVRILAILFLAGATRLSAGVALLVSEPIGRFGFFSPTGHASIYLSGVCAETPTLLRLCQTGETGVVISRYNRISGHDWIAVPLLPYLYAVERPEDVPASANRDVVAQLRDEYRRAQLEVFAPDGPEGEGPKGDWIQLIGAAYHRTVYGFALETTPEDDQRLVDYLNSQPNKRRFNLLYRNCADFASGIINFYYPRAIRRSLLADAGILTPKHSAKALVKNSRSRPEMNLFRFVIPQIPGIRRSSRVRGVSESLVRSKKYVAPVLFLEPWVAAAAGAAYLISGRFNPGGQPHVVCEPGTMPACLASADLELRSAVMPSTSYPTLPTGPPMNPATIGPSPMFACEFVRSFIIVRNDAGGDGMRVAG